MTQLQNQTTNYINILTQQPPINITGNIFICDQLCQLEVKYQNISSPILVYADNTLFFEFNNPQQSPGYIVFNGGDTKSTQQKNYLLKQIIVQAPPKILLNNQSYDMQMNFIHQSEDGKRNIILVVLLQAADGIQSRKMLSYQFFDTIIQNGLPTIEQSTKTIDTITQWNPDELLPLDQTFYTYISQDTVSTYIVFQNPIQISTNARDVMIEQSFGGLQIIQQAQLNPAKLTNPTDLILYGKKTTGDIKSPTDDTVPPAEITINGNQPSGSADNAGVIDTTGAEVEGPKPNTNPNEIVIEYEKPEEKIPIPTATPPSVYGFFSNSSVFYQKLKGGIFFWMTLSGIGVLLYSLFLIWSMTYTTKTLIVYMIKYVVLIFLVLSVGSFGLFVGVRYLSDYMSNNIGSEKFTNILSILEFIGSIFYNLFYGSLSIIFIILTVVLFIKRESFNNEVDESFVQLDWKMKIVSIFSYMLNNTFIKSLSFWFAKNIMKIPEYQDINSDDINLYDIIIKIFNKLMSKNYQSVSNILSNKELKQSLLEQTLTLTPSSQLPISTNNANNILRRFGINRSQIAQKIKESTGLVIPNNISSIIESTTSSNIANVTPIAANNAARLSAIAAETTQAALETAEAAAETAAETAEAVAETTAANLSNISTRAANNAATSATTAANLGNISTRAANNAATSATTAANLGNVLTRAANNAATSATTAANLGNVSTRAANNAANLGNVSTRVANNAATSANNAVNLGNISTRAANNAVRLAATSAENIKQNKNKNKTIRTNNNQLRLLSTRSSNNIINKNKNKNKAILRFNTSPVIE